MLEALGRGEPGSNWKQEAAPDHLPWLWRRPLSSRSGDCDKWLAMGWGGKEQADVGTTSVLGTLTVKGARGLLSVDLGDLHLRTGSGWYNLRNLERGTPR